MRRLVINPGDLYDMSDGVRVVLAGCPGYVWQEGRLERSSFKNELLSVYARLVLTRDGVIKVNVTGGRH